MIFEYLFLVTGNWGSWSEWSECSEECNGGQQSRTRACDDPAPLNGGETCPGDDTEERECNTERCPTEPGKYILFDI